VVLRPTLMFGWFDRKHLGWLSRFMQKVPVFPIPGHGRYLRQPLYVGDFCRVVISSIEHRTQGVYNISGLEGRLHRHHPRDQEGHQGRLLDRQDSLRPVPRAARLGAVRQEAALHHQQLAALVARDVFEVIDWPGIFQVKATPFAKAIDETYNDPEYGSVVLEF
jgi:hypothetical protein